MQTSNHSITAAQDPILEVQNISVTFEMERGTSKVLNDVSIGIQRHEIIGIVGESGSGKSMFASALLDAVAPPGKLTGDITYRPTANEHTDLLSLTDEELTRLRWEEISMVFQGAMSSFNPTMTIRGHFEETLRAHDTDLHEGMTRASELLTDLYLDPSRVLDAYPHELSGGMKQRALIALSLVLQPSVLVMDEPTAALDLLMQRSILSLLSKLQEKYELTLIFITHDLPLVATLCDRIGVLYAFEFAEIGTTDEVLTNPAHPYTKALLSATPNLNSSLDEMSAIDGSSPDPVNTPSGCSYHPRCPLATEDCLKTDPPFNQVSETHESACIHWEEAAESTPTIPTDETFDADESTRVSDVENSIPSTRSDEPVISIQNMDVHFESQSSRLNLFSKPDVVHAVNDVSLEISNNDVIALVGESGCGKTTLGKAAIGLQRPTAGSVKYKGQDIWDSKDGTGEVKIPHEKIRKSLQIIHQDPGSSLNPNKRVRQILSAPLKRWHSNLSRQDREIRIIGMLELVGITPAEDYIQRYPHQLSGGEKQRIALVRALLMNPDLILADEAISALDVSLRVDMMDLLLELQDQFNTSFVFISHDLSNARYLAEKAGGRIGVMYLGQIVEIGPAEEVVKNPKHPYTKALKWATPELVESRRGVGSFPLRSVDIPDPVDPPEGCSFHTRCPEARTACQKQDPKLTDNETSMHEVACFRACEEHEYWDSPPLEEPDEEAIEAPR